MLDEFHPGYFRDLPEVIRMQTADLRHLSPARMILIPEFLRNNFLRRCHGSPPPSGFRLAPLARRAKDAEDRRRGTCPAARGRLSKGLPASHTGRLPGSLPRASLPLADRRA